MAFSETYGQSSDSWRASALAISSVKDWSGTTSALSEIGGSRRPAEGAEKRWRCGAIAALENASTGVSLVAGESLDEGREELLLVSEHGSQSEERGEPAPGAAEDIRREVEMSGEDQPPQNEERRCQINPHRHAASEGGGGEKEWEKETSPVAFQVETKDQLVA
eukprot:972803-Rhodomonas_salina.1